MTYKESESDFQSWVIDCAHVHGWLVAHFRPAKTERGWRTAVSADGAGFPDLVMARKPRLIFAELKSEKGVVTKEQELWLNTIAQCAIINDDPQIGLLYRMPKVCIWRPSDRDKIEEILR